MEPEAVDLRGRVIAQDDTTWRRPVYDRADFSGATFRCPAIFSGAEFRGEALFRGTVFQQGAVFLGCRFRRLADFSWARFTGKAYFWRARFHGPAVFLQAQVEPAAGPREDFPFPGEANFSWAWFEKPADCRRVFFQGPAYFWRTLFFDQIQFAQARFSAAALFEGTPHRVTVSAEDVGGGAMFERLLKLGILLPDPETEPPAYAQFQEGITTAEQLHTRLAEAGLSESTIVEIETLWRRHARKMFPEGAVASFEGVAMDKPEDVSFVRVNFDRCLLAGSAVGKAHLVNVEWDRLPTLFPARRRRAVHDERWLPSTNAWDHVSDLYHALRVSAETRGAMDEAGDFYYGEMEMKRVSRPGLFKYISLTAFYRHLSGYGERHELALTWLAVMILFIFPSLYLLTGYTGDPLAALLRSLEASTFLQAPREATLPLAVRFVEGVQRLLVPVQAGLFVLAVRRRFARK